MTEYQTIFLRYVAELRGARAAASEWWAQIERAEVAKFRTAKQAKASLQERWPFGPMTHPWVLGVYRKYFLLTQALNERNAASLAPPPSVPPSDADWGEDEPDMPDEDDPEAGESFEDMDQVAPWILLIDSLHGVDDKLADAMNWIVYQPVGMDENDNAI